MQGFVNGTLRPISMARPVEHIGFLLSNFHRYSGDSLRIEGGESVRYGLLRWTITTAGYEITIDQDPDLEQLLDRVKMEGGFALGHVGCLRRIDGAPLGPNEAAEVQEALWCFLGFSRGFWSGPVLPFLRRSDRIAATWAPFRVSPWRSVASWFPVHEPQPVGAAFAEFLRLYRDQDWRQPLRHLIGWYIDANTASTLESAVLKAHVAHELLAWFVLVDRRRKDYSRTDAKNLRRLLRECDVPLRIPDELTALKDVASKWWGSADGPKVLVKVRHLIAHPTSENRKELNELGKLGKLEAKALGLHYIDMCLLSLLGYTGTYQPRTIIQGWRGDVRRVPWAT